ncbi:MAG: aldolase/citrate lyase family protein [Verrucomicrobiales bacterium]|nr:aldolase/citrate lyase family protein [Verrucomicrobiales bacterium]
MQFRESLKSGVPKLGTWINSGSPINAEIAAQAGFDFVVVDVEHSPVDLERTHSLFQAIRSGNPDSVPMVRAHGVDYSHLKRYLDLGAGGIIAPFVNTAADAEQLVRTCKYPPMGDRGVGFCRANAYGPNLPEYVATANDEIVLTVQIEHIKGVEAIDEILAVEGIDAAFIGPYDLSASMGITAQFDHPDYIAAKGRVLEACRKHDVVCGLHVVDPDPVQVRDAIEGGYTLVAYSLDITILTHFYRQGVNESMAGLK